MIPFPTAFLWIARIVALIFAVAFGAFVFVTSFLVNRPLPPIDIIVSGLALVYLTGLLLGLKWPGIGGIICLLFPVFEIAHILIANETLAIRHSYYEDTIYTLLVLLIPSLLYFISWYLQVRLKRTT